MLGGVGTKPGCLYVSHHGLQAQDNRGPPARAKPAMNSTLALLKRVPIIEVATGSLRTNGPAGV